MLLKKTNSLWRTNCFYIKAPVIVISCQKLNIKVIYLSFRFLLHHDRINKFIL